MGQKKDLAICIPTYNRAEQVREYLDKTLALLNELGIEIYIFDSSENDLTKEIVEYYQKENHFLFYIRMNSDIPSNIKIMDIWSDEDLLRKYDYIWLMGDSLRWTDSVYRRVAAQLDAKYQVIIPDPFDFKNIGTCILSDKQAVFDNCCVSLTLYGCSILSTDHFIDGTDWEKIKRKYCDEKHLGYSQVGYFFERLDQIEDVRILNLRCFLDAGALTSKISKDNHWTKTSFFNTFLIQWKNTIKDLPKRYKNKIAATKLYDRGVHFITLSNLQKMRLDKTYGLRKYLKYFFQWSSCTDFSLWTLFLAAVLPVDKILMIREPWTESFNKRTQDINEHMYEFACRFEKICIYGAGEIARQKAQFLMDKGISISCFLVSKPVQEESLMGVPIIVYESARVKCENIGVILGMGLSNSKQVFGDHFLEYDKDHVFFEFPYAKDRVICLTDYIDDLKN